MFDQRSVPGGRGSAFEELLRTALAGLAGRRVWIIDHEPHGGRGSTESPDCDGPEIAGFRCLLKTVRGIWPPRRPRLVRSRQAAVQARALAAFARCRPAAELDRPETEVGAAAAASRASQRAVSTEVSEWAVDEVMATLGLSSGPRASCWPIRSPWSSSCRPPWQRCSAG